MAQITALGIYNRLCELNKTHCFCHSRSLIVVFLPFLSLFLLYHVQACTFQNSLCISLTLKLRVAWTFQRVPYYIRTTVTVIFKYTLLTPSNSKGQFPNVTRLSGLPPIGANITLLGRVLGLLWLIIKKRAEYNKKRLDTYVYLNVTFAARHGNSTLKEQTWFLLCID